MAAIILPMGRLSGEVTAAGKTFNESTNGFGDPMLEFTVQPARPEGAEGTSRRAALRAGVLG
jgi:hypothetical protein